MLYMKYLYTGPLSPSSLRFVILLIVIRPYKIAPKMRVFYCCLLYIRDIIKWRLKGEIGHSYAHFVYKILCDGAQLVDLIEPELVEVIELECLEFKGIYLSTYIQSTNEGAS